MDAKILNKVEATFPHALLRSPASLSKANRANRDAKSACFGLPQLFSTLDTSKGQISASSFRNCKKMGTFASLPVYLYSINGVSASMSTRYGSGSAALRDMPAFSRRSRCILDLLVLFTDKGLICLLEGAFLFFFFFFFFLGVFGSVATFGLRRCLCLRLFWGSGVDSLTFFVGCSRSSDSVASGSRVFVSTSSVSYEFELRLIGVPGVSIPLLPSLSSSLGKW